MAGYSVVTENAATKPPVVHRRWSGAWIAEVDFPAPVLSAFTGSQRSGILGHDCCLNGAGAVQIIANAKVAGPDYPNRHHLTGLKRDAAEILGSCRGGTRANGKRYYGHRSKTHHGFAHPVPADSTVDLGTRAGIAGSG
jgi:hypothetical protein